jgi:hypothetical protein
MTAVSMKHHSKTWRQISKIKSGDIHNKRAFFPLITMITTGTRARKNWTKEIAGGNR